MQNIRLATDAERQLYVDWQPHNHEKAHHDGRELLGRCAALLVAVNELDQPRVLLPVKIAATLGAMSHAKNATPREIGMACLALESAACERASKADIDEVIFLGSNPATSRAAIRYAGYSLLNSPVLRKVLS